jgi:hypothetical protein
MKIKLFVLWSILAISSVLGFATLISWDPAEVPPLSLQDALKIVEKKFENHKKYNLVAANLLDISDAQHGKKCQWNLTYGNKSGKITRIYVSSAGDFKVSEDVVDQKFERIISKNEGADRIIKILKDHKLEFEIQTTDKEVIIQSKLTEYQQHEILVNGSFTPELTKVTGPQAGGFYIKLAEISSDRKTKTSLDRMPYWVSEELTVLTKRENVKVLVAAKWGVKFYGQNEEMVRQLVISLGENDFFN